MRKTGSWDSPTGQRRLHIYSDGTFATRAGMALNNGNNLFVTAGSDAAGRGMSGLIFSNWRREVAWRGVYLKDMSALVGERSAVAVWRRAIEPEEGTLRPAEARALLRLKIAEVDLDRADALAARARAGQLTPEEDRELENYLTIGSAVEFLKSKARRSLRKARLAAPSTGPEWVCGIREHW